MSARRPLERIAAELVAKAGASEAPAIVWPLVCGAAVGERTRVIECIAGALRVEVPDATWRAQLTGLAPQYVGNFSRILPSAGIRHIEFVLRSAAK